MSNLDHVNQLTRPRLRRLQSLKTARGRREQRAFLIDGEKLVRDALDANAPILEVLSTKPQKWASASVSMTQLSNADAERISDTRTPQGDFALVRDQLLSATDAISGLEKKSAWSVVALDGVQDPGNVGAIIRSAAAFGVTLVLIGPGSADPTHPRVTRAATGAWFQVPIARSSNLTTDLTALRERGAGVIAADTAGAPLEETSPPGPTIWVFGNEGAGVGPELDPLIDLRVAVPIASTVESLNVSIAAGIILHHATRSARSEGNC